MYDNRNNKILQYQIWRITNFHSVYNFSLTSQSEQVDTLIVGALERVKIKERVFDGSQTTQPSVKRNRRLWVNPGVTSDPQTARYSPSQTREAGTFSNGLQY